VFGWKLIEVQQLIGELAEAGRLSIDVKVSGIKELQVMTV
jgi:hypothetical protein